jgi:AAA+ ATPase superfamily predicted ATPase
VFYGREAELGKLNEMHSSGQFECAVIYGRRRVGKTTLIKEFIKDKTAIYFTAREADGAVNLSGFSRDVYSVTAKELAGNAFFSDWEKAFDYVYQVALDRRIVLAIDEYPYLAGGYGAISSILQAHIDSRLKNSKLFLILCGSSMSFMENQVLGYKSPLYGRRTAQFRLVPFTFFDSLPFLKGFAKTDQGFLYGVTGGIPEYLNKINPGKPLRENIISLFLTPSGHFYEEPSNLIKQELREPSTYNGIIEAIAGGASRLNEIATKRGIESNKCSKYINSLMTLGIVKKETPLTEPVGKKSIYLLEDQMFRFWYRFVFPNMSAVAAGLGEGVYDHEVGPRLNAYMGLTFEEICKQYLLLLARQNALPFFVGNIGRWWGNNPRRKRQEELDIVAFRDGDGDGLFGECKWTNAPLGMDVLAELKERSELFSCKRSWLYLFAKSGFTEALASEAQKDETIRLISFEDM